MQLLWFYIAVALAISDIIHGQLTWNIFSDFYIVFGGILHITTKSNVQSWLIHEFIEAAFHFIVISIIFLNIEIGILAALIHLFIDLIHSLFIRNMGTIEHRALHFVIESLFFILIFGF
ncbi:hypothetical protein BGI41_05445 [Methanobrevibacter sp. 87.7]|uniref:hypothetical protein n=1 Tax=Methanobrevibacter sp. 87.7 TaxID=387957 RepID=UPI000B4FE170|nr:hypothetical protein [Methanobrevibacter sp. 87.7]OWT32854.1 hypothetical protein BGI41_05445 [Methanobrevibacter sp. 87.7]